MYISKSKKFIVSLLAISTILTSAISVSGATLQYVNTKKDNFYTNQITASFTRGCKGTGLYGTNTNKIVTGCYVRLKEGSYDSRRVSNGTKTYAKTSRTNDWFKPCYTYYGWYY